MRISDWSSDVCSSDLLMMLLGTQGDANKGLGALWEGTSWLKTLAGLQPLPTWEPAPLLFNNFAVVFGLVYVHLPFMVLPLYAALDRLDRSLIEASLDLGAGHFRTIMRVVVPLAAPGTVACVLLPLLTAPGASPTPDRLGGTDSQRN